MEVVAANPTNGNVPPFHNHDVREWSRIDSLTGCLERARLETDHWTANTANSTHKYGKVVDSRARSGADGSLQQEAKRQLEVYQSQIPGGRLQVIKTHTVSSSRWTSNSKSTSPVDLQDSLGFENLQLAINPLDVTSQKSKASVGRAVSRRPPSRTPRLHNSAAQDTAATNLYRVSRICHQLHEDAVKRTFAKIPVSERQNGDGVEIIELESDIELEKASKRTKSTSSEDLTILETKSTRSSEDLEDLEQLQNWRRTSKIRRSLQFPKQNKSYSKPNDLPENVGSVRRIKEDLEKGRRLNTALRNNSVDLEALDQILQSISSDNETKTQKRNSFVTVESIQAVKDRLRRTSSPSIDFYPIKDDIDDGIVTGDSTSVDMPRNSKVRSYVFGMEQPKKEISGTGSLESRSKHLNGISLQKNEDWYNRRKSYGFEKVAQQDDTISKSKVESSTDSGICRSSEIIVVPSTKTNDSWSSKNKRDEDWKNWKNEEIEGTMITIPITSKKSPTNARRKLFERELGDGTSYSIETWMNEDENKRHSIAVDESKYVTQNPDQPKYRRTSLAINTHDLEDDDLNAGRKKRVEFCKTEVHFAADSGKVNIVETDEKPPPTNNFRRRRRYSGLIPTEEFNTNGLPVFQFGDPIQNGDSDAEIDDLQNGPLGVVTVNTNLTSDYFRDLEEDSKENFDNSEAPKGILKNKPLKPRPYILGEPPSFENGYDDNYKYTKYNAYEAKYPEHNGQNGNYQENTEDDHIITPWGVKLRPVKDEQAPIWRSTVTVRNTFYNQPEFNDTIEKPKPFRATRRPESFNEKSQDSFGIRIVSPPVDARRSSWSVADRVKQVEDLQFVESKGYSTKINFGNGEAIVVENEKESHHQTWPKREEERNDHQPAIRIPQQLEELRRMYDDVHSDSETDKEVQSLMSKENDGRSDNECSSVVSGSWSRVRAFKNISQYARVHNRVEENQTHLHALLEKDMDSMPHVKLTHAEKTSSIERTKHHQNHQKPTQKTKQSPLPVRKTVPVRNIKDTDKLSSPALVFQKSRTETSNAENVSTKTSSLERSSRIKVKNQSPTRIRTKSPTKEVLRQPKKSEMAYFGVPVSPQVTRKAEKKEIKMSEKPDLLQFHKSQEKPKEPTYENLHNMKNKHNTKREFDASILEELTKAADQILQAVHGYTDDDHNKHSTDDEKLKKNYAREPLDTISETKSWKKTAQSREAKSVSTTKLKATSSNSSLDSTKGNRLETKSRRKPASDSSSVKATTKARRLQRASSREALLQSHGSSSEDLAIEVPIRKPRLVRKTKTTQLTVSNGIEMKKTNSNRRKAEDAKEPKAKTEERVPPIGLPEIRHKTAVSTIRSTAEKAARADKLKTDPRKRVSTSTAQKPRESKGQTATNKTERSRTATAGRDGSQQQKISTANIRKCSRYDGSTKN